jgi:hypothetical protein
MLLLRKEDETLPETEDEALKLVAEELDEFDTKMVALGESPLSAYERSLVRSYLMLKLNQQIPNGSSG